MIIGDNMSLESKEFADEGTIDEFLDKVRDNIDTSLDQVKKEGNKLLMSVDEKQKVIKDLELGILNSDRDEAEEKKKLVRILDSFRLSD